jgi:hypothetical protein
MFGNFFPLGLGQFGSSAAVGWLEKPFPIGWRRYDLPLVGTEAAAHVTVGAGKLGPLNDDITLDDAFDRFS